MKNEHDRIYLAPSCLSFDGSTSCNPDRTWCENPTNECPDCGNKPTTYLLATPTREAAEKLYLALSSILAWLNSPSISTISIADVKERAEVTLELADGKVS